MFAINHAATGLISKQIYPDVPMAVILLSVQLIEILWVLLNSLRLILQFSPKREAFSGTGPRSH